ncbi:MAG: 3-methyladenine DNA glycosylase AlkC [Cyclobacteriaceae bacterium]|jgi:3-methyladenine DNA glycosylase AlkC
MAEPLKNQFFQQTFFEAMGGKIQDHYSHWSNKEFFRLIYTSDWEDMELKQRMKHASLALGKCLPAEYDKAIVILQQSLPDQARFEGLLYSEYVQHHGMKQPELSLAALELFTQYGSAEFAIRPFIMEHESITMKQMLQWTQSENVHVRRLASEGCRPRLPWAPALPKFKSNPAPVMAILDKLKEDPELYVRKSVANNLNDITKDHPDVVIKYLREWNKKATANIRWITKQALRGLIKAGDSDALALVGIHPAKALVSDLDLPTIVSFGEKFKIKFRLSNLESKPCAFLVDYVVHHQKANGTLTPKIFKLGNYQLKAEETIAIEKQHAFILITTRKYYAGEHKISIQVNGKILAEKPFILEID